MVRFKFVEKKGFTLVEMLIAMAIFISFTAVLIGSYTSIVKAQREANEYRIMYSEARKVFETLIQELRDGMVYYDRVGGFIQDDGKLVFFISKDGNKQTQISYNEYVPGQADSGKVTLEHLALTGVDVTGFPVYAVSDSVDLNDPSRVQITNFELYVTPNVDPYAEKNVGNNGVQFQPKVTVYTNFQREMTNGKIFNMDLQTSVSSRVYNQIVPNADSKKEE